MAPAEDELVMRNPRKSRFEPPADARTILTQRGFNLTQAERASGLSRGSLSRILAGRRCGLRLETMRRLSRGTRIPLGVLVEALETSITGAQERAERRQRVEEAIDAARCG
jgi:transcriptional regulator with XRE-family HTH domain